jgi:signal transduction histidine kinase
MILAAALRFLGSKSYLQRPEKNAWRAIEYGCWLNCVAWGVIYALVSYELRNRGLHFAVLIAVMTGALSGSLVTLANRPNLYLPFLFVSIVPLSVVSLIQWLVWKQEAGIIYLMIYAFYAFYQLIQFRNIRDIQYDRVKKQIDLEASLEELKLSQEAFVKQTAKLFHASKLSALGEMAGGLSHEVNNSLMTIMGSVQQLDRYFQRDKITNPEYNKKIQNSHQAISQIKTVIDGLRFFSQQADEGEKIDRPLEEIIQRTLNFCNEMVKANEITMIVAPVPPVMVHCNPMQITQILFYLTKNAFDALEGVNDPMKRWIRISFIEKEQDVEIRVMNGGPQISADVKNRLFQPFFTTKEVGKGTGLSLSISKGIALAHRGDIYLDDNTDCTTFALKIPAAPLAGVAHA